MAQKQPRIIRVRSPGGNTMLSTMVGVQYRWGYLEHRWRYASTVGGVQYRDDILGTVGVILSTVGIS